MPAHFTSNGDRTQSFCIDFEPLTADDDYNMASEAWYSISNFLSSDASKDDFDMILRCGEDVIVGAYIITKLGHQEMVSEMKRGVLDDTIETFELDYPNVRTLLEDVSVNKYLDHCIESGKEQALKSARPE